MISKHFFSARLCAEASVVKAYGCTSLAGLISQAKAGRAGRAYEALVRQHRHRHTVNINRKVVGILKVFYQLPGNPSAPTIKSFSCYRKSFNHYW